MSTKTYRKLTRIETELRAALRREIISGVVDTSGVTRLYAAYRAAGGCEHLKVMEDQERAAIEKRPCPLQVTS